MNDLARIFADRGDLAHLALFLWASGSSGLLAWTLRELSLSNRRFNDFVAEIARFNQAFSDIRQPSEETRSCPRSSSNS